MCRYKIINLIIFFQFILLRICAETVPLDKTIDSLVEKYLPNSFVGIVIKDSDKKIYYSRNSNRHFIPASNVKLFTCAAAMLDLGKDFKYTTSFQIHKSLLSNNILNGDLYIKFTGDPTYSSKMLYDNLMQLKKLGIGTIRGNIIIDNTLFTGSDYPHGMSYDDIGCSYAVPVNSLVLDSNQVKIEIKGCRISGNNAEIIQNTQTKYFDIENEVLTVDSNEKGDEYAEISARIDDKNNIKISGKVSADYKTERVLAIQNSFEYTKRVLESLFRKANIWFDRKIILGETPSNTDPVIVNASRPLPDLIKHALKESDNLYTESFLKTMGGQRDGTGNYKNGLDVLFDALRRITEIRFNNLKLYDGSGLSRYDLVTPEQITDLLTGIYNNEQLNEYIVNALPVFGVDGTLKNRLKLSDDKNYIKAKTGSMGGVSALSGYIFIDRKSPVIFSILSNGVVNIQNPKIAKDFEDQLCKLLLEYFKTAE